MFNPLTVTNLHTWKYLIAALPGSKYTNWDRVIQAPKNRKILYQQSHYYNGT
jgi:hypothetical protein